MHGLDALLAQVRACQRCAAHLPHGCRPVFQLHPHARILVVGQAPGRRAHAAGRPFDDPSGDRLRDWLGVSAALFYDPRCFALLPMGLCYPGSANGSDLPPRPECAPAWRAALIAHLPRVALTLLLGRYARDAHLPGERGLPLAASVARWREHGPGLAVAPHPSPRNRHWCSLNPGFEHELLPAVQARVAALLDH